MGLLITAGFQLVVVALSGSIALLADTMHNFGDAITALLLWVAFVLAAERPASGSPMASAALKTSPAWSSSLLWL
jgi:divalent metal cation (Fe/Co/Zn/Cd) transporter